MEEDRIIEIAMRRIKEANERTLAPAEAMYDLAISFNQTDETYCGPCIGRKIHEVIKNWKEKYLDAGTESEESSVSD